MITRVEEGTEWVARRAAKCAAGPGSRAKVVGVAGRLVEFVSDVGAHVRSIYEFQSLFKMAPEAAERRAIRHYFLMSINNLAHARMYYLPTPAAPRKSRRSEGLAAPRHVVARALVAERVFKLPRDAILVGIYSHPCPPGHFLEDLDAVIAKLAAEKRSNVEQQEPQPAYA